MGCVASEPKGTILIGLYSLAQNNPERIFFEQLTHRSLLFENSDGSEEEGVRKVLVNKKFVLAQSQLSCLMLQVF
jgi:hypothetical protein